MNRILITRADEVLEIISNADITAVLSIEHPGAVEGSKGAAPRVQDKKPQLVLSFWDTEQEVPQGPDMKQVETGIEFVLMHLSQGDVLVHCHAGKSRSAAVVLGVLAMQYPDEGENALLEKLLDIRPVSAPNIIIVEMVDRLAGRGGKLLAAVLAHPVLTAQRAEAEAARQAYMKDPEMMKKFLPEKNFKP